MRNLRLIIQPAKRFLVSLATAAVVSFVLPLVVIGLVWLGLAGYTVAMPSLGLGDGGLIYFHRFLAILGNGNPWQGTLAIAVSSAVVGLLFDGFALYRDRTFSHR